MKNKFALCSHVLPPSDSGQAVMLYRLLEKFPKSDYILLSSKNYADLKNEPKSSKKLSGKYYFLDPILKFNLATRFFWDIFFLHRATLFIVTIRAFAKEIDNILKKEQCNTLVVCTGGFFDLPAAYLVTRKTKIHLVVYSFDDYIYQWTGLPRLVARLTAFFAFKRANSLIVPNEFLKRNYEKRFKKRSIIVRNPYLPLPLKNQISPFNHDEINIIYTGSVYFAHLDAFKNLILAIELINKPVKLHIFSGQSTDKLKRDGLVGENIEIHKNINQAQIYAVQKQADILFLPLAFNSPINEVIKTSAPGKIGEYLASEKPILVHAPKDSFLCWYFKKRRCGLVVDQNDFSKLAKALEQIIDKKYSKMLIKNAKIASEDFSIKLSQENFKKSIKYL